MSQLASLGALHFLHNLGYSMKRPEKFDILDEIKYEMVERSRISREKVVDFFLCKDANCLRCNQSTNKNSEVLPCTLNGDKNYDEGFLIKFAFLTCVRCKGSKNVIEQAVNGFRKLIKIKDEDEHGAEIRKMVEMTPEQYMSAIHDNSDKELTSLISTLSIVFMGAILVGSI